MTATDARYLPGGDRYDDRRTLTRRTRRYRAIVVLIVPPVAVVPACAQPVEIP